MPKINYRIPNQGFEFVRDRIANILDDELNNQSYMYLDEDLEAGVVIENNNPYKDIKDLSIINVSLSGGTYDQKHMNSVVGAYPYFIDVTCYAKSNKDAAGDYFSSLKLERLVGAIRYILEDPDYKTLGFTPGFITRTFINNFDISDQVKNDSLSVTTCRIVFMVQLVESNKFKTPSLIDGYDTKVTLGGTNKGYQFIGNNY
ncbi:MAG TPA: hypothetical protein VN922_19675 [Bacteroidia bacterium]|nr:hypothetical protein [Bacteroidia bacterium]